MKLSIIMPVFNEEKTVRKIIKRIDDLRISDIEKEIIIVDDGSTDATASELRTSNFELRNLKIFSHRKNLGKGAAVRTGIKNATGMYIVIQDADLEYNPEDIKKLIKPIAENKAKVVYGTRLNRLPNLFKDEKKLIFLIHYLGNRFLSLLTSILYKQWITDMETCYKLFPREAVLDLNIRAKGFDFEPEITSKLLKRGYRILEIPITTIPRSYSEGKKLNTFRDGIKALWTLLKYRFTD